jgi:AGZA family xanthine/uracil permease-like MFS transporter
MFRLRENNTTVGREILGGVTTFMTMAYIIFVNPVFLKKAGMGEQEVMLATCVASAVGCILMALLANYPIALAPGMGMNALFAYTICLTYKVPWQGALALVLISGVIFLILSAVRVREMIMDAVPDCLKFAAAVGIGVFIALIGFEHTGLVQPRTGTYIAFAKELTRPTLLALGGLMFTMLLMAWRIPGAILWGMIATAVVGMFIPYQGGYLVPRPTQVFAVPQAKFPGFEISFRKAFTFPGADVGTVIMLIVVLLFFDIFDTLGTLVGVSEQAGFLKDGKLPRASKALMADSLATCAGAGLGTSTVTSYIESCAGVAVGARTGLANLITAALFLLALLFMPLMEVFGTSCRVSISAKELIPAVEKPKQITLCLYPVTAPALIIVGSLMVRSVTKIKWDDVTDALPAFLTIVVMPFTFNISHGLAAGIISYPVLKLLSGKARQVHWLMYILAVAFVLRYALATVY